MGSKGRGWWHPSLAQSRGRGAGSSRARSTCGRAGSVLGGQPRCGRLRRALPNPPCLHTTVSGEHFGHSWIFFFSGKKKKKAACFFAEKVGGVATAACSPPGCRGVVVAGRWRGSAVPLLTPRVQLWSPSPRGSGRNWEGVASVEMEVAEGSWELQQGWEGCAEGRGTGEAARLCLAGWAPAPVEGVRTRPRTGPACPRAALLHLSVLLVPCVPLWHLLLLPPHWHRAGGTSALSQDIEPLTERARCRGRLPARCKPQGPPRAQQGGQQPPPTPCKGKETLSPE